MADLKQQQSHYEPFAHALMEFRADLSALTPAEHERLIRLNEQLELQGFFAPVIQVLESDDDEYRVVLATWFNLERDVVARAVISEAVSKPPLVLLSEFDDGSFLLSTPTRGSDSVPERVRQNRFEGADVAVLLASHRRKLSSELQARHALRIESADEIYGLLERYHQTWREHSQASLSSADAVSAVIPGSPEEEQDFVIVNEMRRLQQQSSGGGFGILVVSLVAFVVLGRGFDDWNWKTMVLLVPVLLFHELGHFLAMKVFGYRNLKMFFIPLFGAAVSGKQYNVPGWKRAVVSLAGPVPGIMLAVILAAIDSITPVPHARWIIIELALLNGFNLLPILPLDGGWVVGTLFFSRHAWLYGFFQLMTAIAAGLLAVLTQSIFFGLVAVSMLLGLPLGLKLTRLAIKLRREGLASHSGDDSISNELGLKIARELRPLMPATMTSAQIAPSGLIVFERLNTTPPGFLATGFLSAVHLVAFIAAVSVPFIDAGFRQIRQGAQALSAHQSEWRCGDIKTTLAAAQSDVPEGFIVASFETSEAAQQWYAQHDWSQSPQISRVLLGRSLVVAVPARDRFLEDELRTSARHVFYSKSLQLTVVATAGEGEQAERATSELKSYFALQGGHLIEPWNPLHKIHEQATRMRALRLRYDNEVARAAINDPRVVELRQQISSKRPKLGRRPNADARNPQQPADPANAHLTKEMQDWMQLSKELSKLIEQVQEELHAKLLGTLETDDERDFLKLCREVTRQSLDEDEDEDEDAAAIEARKQRWLELGKYAGQLPLVAEEPSAHDARFAASGMANLVDRRCSIFVNLRRPEHALPAIADYLCRNGYALNRYVISATTVDFEE